jgi:hypothetical protein
MHPSNWAKGQNSIQFNPQLWQAQEAQARSWLAANGSSSGAGAGGVTHLSFGGDFR